MRVVAEFQRPTGSSGLDRNRHALAHRDLTAYPERSRVRSVGAAPVDLDDVVPVACPGFLTVTATVTPSASVAVTGGLSA